MSQAIQSPRPIPKEISRKLGSLRRGINIWLLVRGLSRLLIAFVLLAGLDFLIDRYFEMDLAQRTIMMVIIGIVLVSILFWDFIRPFFGRTRDDALLLQVEEKHEDLKESLISAAQFSRQENLQAQGVSQAMVDATIQEGTEKAKSISFNSVLDSDKFILNFILLLVAGGLIAFAGYEISQKEGPLSIWFKRNFMLADAEYPRKTYLYFPEIEGNKLTIARGENLTVLAAIRKSSDIQDVDVFLDYRDASESYFTKMKVYRPKKDDLSEKAAKGPNEKKSEDETSESETKEVVEIDPDAERRFTGLVSKVSSKFQFRARGGDGSTRWIDVELVEPPAVTNLVLTINMPEYTKYVPKKIPDPNDPNGDNNEDEPPKKQGPITFQGSGPHSVLNGSSLTLSAEANKPLKTATLMTPSGEMIDLLSPGNSKKLSAEISTELLISGKYKFSLVDEEGLDTNKLSAKPASFGIKIRPDKPPVVRASLEGISGLVVPRATVPINIFIRDDYLVTDANWAFNWKGDTSNSKPVEGEIPFEGIDRDYLNQKEVSFTPVLVDLTPLKIPAGAGLRFSVTALDNDEIAGPNKGQSTEFLLRVVTEDELLADLLRREKEQRQEFDRLFKEQKELLLEAEAMQADTPENVKDVQAYYSKKNRDLILLTRRQKLVGTNLATIADRFQDFLIETLNNQIEDKGGRLRSEIVRPLRRLSEFEIPMLTDEYLESSRRSLRTEAWKEDIAKVVEEKQKVIDAMARVAVSMAKSESFQEGVAALREIEKSEGDLARRIREERKARINQGIFGTDKDKKDDDPEKDPEKGSEDDPEKKDPEEGKD